MNTTENNKLIAEFMGMTYGDPNDNSVMIQMTPQGNEVVPIESMQYHTSWDWLIPVANEIIKSRDEQNANWDLTDLKYSLQTTNIKLVYKSVLEFIKENKTMKVKTTEQRGGGYINEVSVAKFRAIKTPLHLYSEWNIKVNKCNSLEEIQTLLKKDKNN